MGMIVLRMTNMSPGQLAINRSILLQGAENGSTWRWIAIAAIIGLLSLTVVMWLRINHDKRSDEVSLPITPVVVIPASAVLLESASEIASTHPQESLSIQEQGDQVVVSNRPEQIVVAPVAQMKPPIVEVKRQVAAPPVKPTSATSVAASSPCAIPFSANAVAMSAAGIRSVLPGVVSYAVGGVSCSLKVGSALGEERVVDVDAELLRIHTDKRTIQLIDK